MKRSLIVEGKTFANDAKGKWYSERHITTIEDDYVSYVVIRGRGIGKKGSMTLSGFAHWAAREVN